MAEATGAATAATSVPVSFADVVARSDTATMSRADLIALLRRTEDRLAVSRTQHQSVMETIGKKDHVNELLTMSTTGPAPSLMPPALASLPIATTLAAASARPIAIAGPAAARFAFRVCNASSRE